MKVFWFTNSPSLAKKKLNQISYGGSWMESLQGELQKEEKIDLSLSFYSTKPIEPFEFEGTNYYPIQRERVRNRFEKHRNRVSHKIEDPNIELEKYKQVIEMVNPDIIHVFGSEFPFGLITKITKIPVIIWIQGNICVYNNKWFSGIPHDIISKYTPLSRKIKRTGLLDEYERLLKVGSREIEIFKYCKYFWGRTDWDRRLVKLLANNNAIYFHSEEMLRSSFYETQWKPPENNEFNILSVLIPNIYKGFETIFEAKKLIEEYSDKKITWKIAGCTGNEDIFKIIKKWQKRDVKKLNIIFLGKLFEKDLINEFLSANLFVHPSHIENSPNSLCEAMILGMPIIATPVGGVMNMLENNKEGLLVQDGDSYALAGAILESVDNYNNMVSLGVNARRRALNRHEPKAIVNNLLDTYYKIISSETSWKNNR